MKKFIVLILLIGSFNMHAKPTAVLFDCDGVLVDTEYMKFEAWNKSLSQVNINLTIEDYMALAGSSSKVIAKEISANKKCNFDMEKVIADKNAFYKKEHLKGVPPIKPAVQYLNFLLEQKNKLNIKIAVVSSDSREAIMRNLNFAGVKHELLDGIYSGHDDLKHINDSEGTNKPKPYIYMLAAQKLGIDPKSTVVFEDTNAGVISASLAGMDVIAVPNIFTIDQDFSNAKLVTNFDKFSISDLMIIN